MLTIRAAATLIAGTDSEDGLRQLARTLRFEDPPQPLAVSQLRELDDSLQKAWISNGPGALRLMIALLDPSTGHWPGADSRESTRRLCLRLARTNPMQHWCAITLDNEKRTLCIATVTPHANGPRIAALRVDRSHVVDSDAETVRALATVTTDQDVLRHARFTDILRRDGLSSRFYRALEHTVTQLSNTSTGRASADERHELALLCTSRCLFLAFLQAKGWLDSNPDFLLHQCTRALEQGGQLHQRLLRPLFFGTLNTPVRQRAPAARSFGRIPFLNGGLFSATALEKKRSNVRFTDEAIIALVGELLDRYRFTAHEDSASWSEAAIDPEMLGRAFECLMVRDERRRSGSFYTPPLLVDVVVREALQSAFPALPPESLTAYHSDSPLHLDTETRERLTSSRILDPACGSGAFLVHALERISSLLQRSGDARPVHVIRREILTRCIFGVDRNPIAVWLCELRLWLSVVIECTEADPARVSPLPNLDHNIRVGDTLQGGDFAFIPRGASRTSALRDRYSRATGTRKQSLARQLERLQRQSAIDAATRRCEQVVHRRVELLQSLRQRDLFGDRTKPTRADRAQLLELRRQYRELTAHRTRLELGGALPFRFATHFPDASASGGFPLIIGNPPWVRPHAMPAIERTRLRGEYRTLREAAWRAGAARAGASTSFAAQADLSAAFLERSIELLAPGGVLALLVPAKLWRSLAGGGLRRLLAERTDVRSIHDWSDAPSLFEAATYPSLIVAQRRIDELPASTEAPLTISIVRATRTHSFTTPHHSLTLTPDSASPWILLPRSPRTAFQRILTSGPALGDTHMGRPLLGIKCGCNDAFLVNAAESEDEMALVTSGERQGVIERQLLRPVLRGESVGHRAASSHATHIVWTHSREGKPLTRLPPATNRWLSHWRPRLELRRDSHRRTPWWTLFRTEGARFELARVVWADFGKRLRAIVIPPGDPTVPLNTCYVMPTASLDDAYALHALLTSPIAAAWLDVIAEPARGGFRRFLGWTVASLPMPEDWLATRLPLAAFGRRACNGETMSADEHAALVADAYRLPLKCIQPLLEWTER